MRVLHVVATTERRGAEKFASQLVEALAGDGLSQHVAIIRCGDDPVLRFRAPTTLVGTNRRPIPGLRMDADAIRNLRRVVAAFSPDVVQAHGGEPLKYTLAVERGRGARIVYRRIGDARQFRGSRLRRRAYVGLMRRAARVVSVADAVRAELVDDFGLSPSRVVTIPNGVDVSTWGSTRPRAQIRARLGIARDALVVLSLGALTWEKDPLAHIEIVTRATNGHPGLLHLMAGDGPLRTAVEAEIKRRGEEARTRLLGTRDDVPDLLAASDVLLLASRTEGMPACVIEAGMAALPVAAYSISGVPEVVLDGETGLLAPHGDVDALTHALERLIGDADLRRRLGEAGRRRCLARFDIRIVAQEYLNVYRAVARVA